jgi:hypothetical protein
MRKHLFVLALSILAVTWGATAAAATADFQGIGTGYTPSYFQFDSTRTSTYGSGTSCGSASIVSYFWNYGDGSSSGFGYYPVVSHIYTGTNVYSLTLSVFCSDNSSASITHCVNTTHIGANGCIHPDSGWQP